MPSNDLIFCHPLLLLPSVFPSIRVFSNKSVLCIRWKSTGVSASASVLPINIQGWLPLGLTGWNSLLFKGLSRVFSNTTVRAYWKPTDLGALIFQFHIFLPFRTVHGVFKARIVKWFAIPFSSGPRFVSTLCHDRSTLSGPIWHGSQFHWVRQGHVPCDKFD